MVKAARRHNDLIIATDGGADFGLSAIGYAAGCVDDFYPVTRRIGIAGCDATPFTAELCAFLQCILGLVCCADSRRAAFFPSRIVFLIDCKAVIDFVHRTIPPDERAFLGSAVRHTHGPCLRRVPNSTLSGYRRMARNSTGIRLPLATFAARSADDTTTLQIALAPLRYKICYMISINSLGDAPSPLLRFGPPELWMSLRRWHRCTQLGSGIGWLLAVPPLLLRTTCDHLRPADAGEPLLLEGGLRQLQNFTDGDKAMTMAMAIGKGL